MIADQPYPAPLTSAQVGRLKALPPEADPPERVTLNLGTFRLPEGTEATIFQSRGAPTLTTFRSICPGKPLGVACRTSASRRSSWIAPR
jgi:hypothetical protein